MKRTTALLLMVVLIAGLFLTVSAPPAQAQVIDTYAAIAYSPSTGLYGYSRGFNSRYAAELAALSNCAVFDARVVVWVRNGWCALAVGNGPGISGYAYSAVDELTARQLALAECNSRTTGAYIAVSVYSGG